MLDIFRKKQEDSVFVSAVVLCAGNSTRMGDKVNKQLIMINDIPVVMYSVMAFENCDIVDEIVLVTKEEMLGDINAMVREFGCSKVKTIVKGGDVRTQSSIIGVESTSAESDYVLIHDGARPIIDGDLIRSVVEYAVEYGATAPSTPIYETVKRIDCDGKVIETLDRQQLRTIQTPQGFSKKLYLRAAKQCSDRTDLFDDCQLVEAIGGEVVLVEGNRDNIKITTLDDLDTARDLLNKRDERGL